MKTTKIMFFLIIVALIVGCSTLGFETGEEQTKVGSVKAGENEIKLNGSGRTDAGVHAIGQVANFVTQNNLPIEKWPIVLNYNLPGDIRIKNAKEVNITFHARYSAKSKLYKYYVMNRFYKADIISAKHVLLKNYCYFLNNRLDIDRMKEVTKYLVGYHDFSSLSCLNKKKDERKQYKKRTISRFNIKKKEQIVCFSIEADAFLYKMVRIIIGTLIDFSINQRKPEEIIQILENKDNQNSGKVVPPQGLYLVKVNY